MVHGGTTSVHAGTIVLSLSNTICDYTQFISYFSNLNGKYFDKQTDNEQGIFWDRWYSYKSLKSVQMMIRPKNVKNE